MSIKDGPTVQVEYNKSEIFSEKMTLLDEFAAAVLPACYAQLAKELGGKDWPGHCWQDDVANRAYCVAQAMLNVRKEWMDGTRIDDDELF